MIRAGIISFAHMHAHSYAACLAEIEGAELAGVWDADAKRGRAAGREHGAKFYKELDALLASDIDAVIVCSENVLHRAHVEAAAKAGKWVLCEKPLATTVRDAKAMIKACERAGVGLGTAFPCRYAGPLLRAKAELRQTVGKVLSASCTNNGQFPGGWFADPALSGGGAVMDHTVHVADVLRWLTGAEFTKVYCACANRFHPEIDVDDVGGLQLEMEGGVIVSHVASWNRPEGFPTWGDLTLDIVGTKGTLRVDAFNEKIVHYPNADKRAQWIPFGVNADRGLLEDFLESVRKRKQPPISGEDGLRAVEVTVAAYRSAKKGQVVSLPATSKPN